MATVRMKKTTKNAMTRMVSMVVRWLVFEGFGEVFVDVVEFL